MTTTNEMVAKVARLQARIETIRPEVGMRQTEEALIKAEVALAWATR